jgi:polysaccharide chain length determinant protein (PEP-CTERM system associated)
LESLQFVKDIFIALKFELIRFRALAAALFSVVFLVVLLVALNWPKTYLSTASVRMDVTNVIEPLLRGAAEVTEDQIDRVPEIITSRRILERVLYRVNPKAKDFDPEAKEKAINRIYRSLTVVNSPVARNVTNLSYLSHDPDIAFKNLTAVIEVFIEDRAAEKQKDSYDAHSFISAQVVGYKKRLEEAEIRLKDFKSRSVSATEQSVAERISELTSQIENLKIAINESEVKIGTTQSQLQVETSSLDVRNQLGALKQRRQALTNELDRLRLNYQDSYPDVVALKAQVAELDQRIDAISASKGWNSESNSELPLYEELRKQLSAAQVEFTTQQRRLAALEELLEKEKTLASQVAANQAELMDLTRDYDVTKKTYEEMLSRKENANLTLALNDEGQGASFKVLEPPVYPLKPEGLRALFIFLAAPIVALGAPVGLIVLYVFIDPRIRSLTLLQQKLPEGLTVMSYVPHRGTSLARRLLRKDMLLLLILALILISVYVYTFVMFGKIL